MATTRATVRTPTAPGIGPAAVTFDERGARRPVRLP